MPVDGVQRYKIVYTRTAVDDIEQKADYITFQLHDLVLSEVWYERLKAQIQENLATFPLKYPLYDVPPWQEQGIHLFVTRNDVVLYSVDTDSYTVYIHTVCTKGRALPAHLEAQKSE